MENEPIEYAGFWIRFVAYIIDGVIISLLEFLLVLPLLGLIGINTLTIDSSTYESMDWELLLPLLISAGTGLYLSAFLLTWLYYALMESGARQGTVGKMAIGVIVIDENGNRLNFAKASIRYFSKIISSILLIGYIIAAFTPKKQALHDIIANTYVVRK